MLLQDAGLYRDLSGGFYVLNAREKLKVLHDLKAGKQFYDQLMIENSSTRR